MVHYSESIKMENKTYHSVRNVPKSNGKIVERNIIDTHNTQTHNTQIPDRSLFKLV